ncbi:hypothetical protein ACNSOP_09020 [Aliarcobacter lanthieri]|uniref:hypothetical protein n=1 Tax=Aliarcobacter lanthieri TaxID=1355374 RepID=UPI003AAB5CC0
MSALESFEIDTVRKEEQEKFTKEDEYNLDEFVGMLQDAFCFGNKNLDEDLIYIALEKTFKEYFDGVDIEIRKNYIKKFLQVS